MKNSKNKLTNLLKTGMLFFGISLLLWNCEKDETNFIPELTVPEPLAKKITLEKFQKENNTATIFNDISENLDIKKGYQSKSSKSKDKIVVLTDKILKVEKNEVITYSFVLEKPTSDASDFENLMVFKYADNSHKFIILKYQYTGNEEKPYKIKYKQINADELKSFNYVKQFLAKAGEDLLLDDCVEVSHWCPSGGSNYHEPEVCGSGTGTTETTLDFSNCFNIGTGGNGGLVDSGDGDIEDTDNTNGNSGGGGSNSGGTGAVNIPIEPSDFAIIAKRIAGILGLNNLERDWLNGQDQTTVLGIQSFLDENGTTFEVKNLVKDGIKEMMSGNEIDYNVSDLIDVEPVQVYMGTISNFKNLIDNSPRKVGKFKGIEASNYLKSLGETKFNFKQMRPLPTQTGFFNSKKGRYIYTKKGGWIDMAHFMFYAGKAYQYKLDGKSNPIGEAVQDGFNQELSDSFVAKHSAYSYEDLPSDKFGAEFAVNYFDSNINVTFSEQLTNYFNNTLKASTPEDAPNYNDIPSKDSKNNPTKINKTTTPIFTK